MNNESSERLAICNEIFDIADVGFDVFYEKISENQALNIALCKILDDGFDIHASLEVRSAINNALALLRTQETALKALNSSIDNVSEKLVNIVRKYEYDKSKPEEVFKNE